MLQLPPGCTTRCCKEHRTCLQRCLQVLKCKKDGISTLVSIACNKNVSPSWHVPTHIHLLFWCREFVVNLISDWYIEAANHTCGNFPRGVDEMSLAGLTPEPSQQVKPPRVREAAVQMECRLKDIININDRCVCLVSLCAKGDWGGTLFLLKPGCLYCNHDLYCIVPMLLCSTTARLSPQRLMHRRGSCKCSHLLRMIALREASYMSPVQLARYW
jgi:hypothetical protein